MTTKTIDEKIRAKARKELETEVTNLFSTFSRDVCKLLDAETWHKISILNPEEVKYNFGDVLRIIHKDFIAAKVESHEQKAVDEFLNKVETMQEELDNLYAEVNNG